MITQDQLTQFLGYKPDPALLDAIDKTLVRFGISTPRRVRYFMAQGYSESKFKDFSENLVYTTPERLVAVWPSRFSLTQGGSKAYAADYVRAPQKLANLVYGGRNGNTDPDDGWKFIGRGVFGLTGKANYQAYSRAMYGDDRCVKNPEMVATLPDAVLSAGWFWKTNGLNELADADAYTKATIVINGSAATVPERLVFLGKAKVFT
jgi:putative chitinase